MGFFKRSFSFEGKVGRMEFFLELVFSTVLAIVISLAFGGVLATDTEGALAILSFLAFIPSIYIYIAAHIKRIRDVGKPGLWVLLLLVPIVGFIFQLYLLFKRGESARK